MKESGGALIIFAGLVLVIAGFNGTLGDVWHALLKESGGNSFGSTPNTSTLPTSVQNALNQNPAATGRGSPNLSPTIPALNYQNSPPAPINTPGSGVASN